MDQSQITQQQTPPSQQKISEDNIFKTKKFLEIYNNEFPQIIKLLNDSLKFEKEKLIQDNEKNKTLTNQINEIKVNETSTELKIDNNPTENTAVVYKLEILEKTESDLSQEEENTLKKIEENLKIENEKTEKDQNKIDKLNQEKYSINHKIIASCISNLIKITQQLNSLKERITTITLKKEINENNEIKILEQTFESKNEYSKALDQVFSKASELTQKLSNLLSKKTSIAPENSISDLIVIQNEEKTFVSDEAINNLLKDHKNLNINNDLTLETLIEAFHSGEVSLSNK
jgi:hypothetical protein